VLTVVAAGDPVDLGGGDQLGLASMVRKRGDQV
jgi:hypothetical protein